MFHFFKKKQRDTKSPKTEQVQETKEKNREKLMKSQENIANIENLAEKISKYDLDSLNEALALLKEEKIQASFKMSYEEKKAEDEFQAKAMKLFKLTDQDKNGVIDEEELRDLMLELVGPISLAESNLLYSEMDKNGSGSITFDEFLDALKKFQFDFSHIDLGKEKLRSTKQLAQWEVNLSELKYGDKLREETYSISYKGKWRGLDVSIKQMKRSKKYFEDNLNLFLKECSVLAYLRHPNILLFIGSSTDDLERMTLVTEYLSGGTLHDLVHIEKKALSLRTIIDFAKQTVIGMNYLHLSKIIHHNLKLSNLMIDKNYNLKVSGFGLSCLLDDKDEIPEETWIAPEILMKKDYNSSVDVYSFALCLWEMFTNKASYVELSKEEFKDKVCKENYRPSIPDSCANDMKSLLRLCWHPEPFRRLSFAQIIGVLDSIERHL